MPEVVKQGPGCGFDRLRAPDDPAKAGGRATDHGTWTDTDTNTSVRLTTCRSPRRSFPPRSERWSWKGATGWRRKSLAPRCAAAVIPSWPGPTSTIRPTAACRWTRRGAWSGTCPGPAGGWGYAAGGGPDPAGAADPTVGVAGASAFPPSPAHVPGAVVESGGRSHRTAVHVVERLPPAVLQCRDHHRAGRAAPPGGGPRRGLSLPDT